MMGRHRSQTAEPDLTVCPYCGGGKVYPLDWEEAGPWHWRLVLHCPDCHKSGTIVATQAATERFDNALERAGAELQADLRRLTRANMSTEADTLRQALELDLIGADDFAP